MWRSAAAVGGGCGASAPYAFHLKQVESTTGGDLAAAAVATAPPPERPQRREIAEAPARFLTLLSLE